MTLLIVLFGLTSFFGGFILGAAFIIGFVPQILESANDPATSNP